jgi:hypothetical protein
LTKKPATHSEDKKSTNLNESDSPSSSFFDEVASLYNSVGWKNPLLFSQRSTSLDKLLARFNKTIEESHKFKNKIKSNELACINRTKSIPENTTIRREYINCGKQLCYTGEKHGPYYYAYWKEDKKLKKKYIGTHLPKDKEGVLGNNDDDKN